MPCLVSRLGLPAGEKVSPLQTGPPRLGPSEFPVPLGKPLVVWSPILPHTPFSSPCHFTMLVEPDPGPACNVGRARVERREGHFEFERPPLVAKLECGTPGSSSRLHSESL